MTSLPTRQDLSRLLEHTGVRLPESNFLPEQDAFIWGSLLLVHLTVFVGLWDLCIRLH